MLEAVQGGAMTIRELRFESEVAAPRARVFDFFSDASNLVPLTPPWVQVEWMGERQPTMRAGLEVKYRVRLRGISFRWRGTITVWDPPNRFVDVQRRGPYRFWEHEHRFEETARGTRVVDHVRYAVWGGGWVDRWKVRPELERMFRYRQEVLPRLLGIAGA